jgi:hypothetical protein
MKRIAIATYLLLFGLLKYGNAQWTDFSSFTGSTNLSNAMNSKASLQVSMGAPTVSCHAAGDVDADIANFVWYVCTTTNNWHRMPGSTDGLPEGSSNLYFTAARAVTALAGLYEVPLTFGSGLTRASNAIACNVASGSVAGCLSSADFTTFAAKQAALTAYSTISGLSGYPSTFPPTAHNLLSTYHGDTTASAAVRGGAIFAVGATPAWTQIAHSTAAGGYWKWNGADVVASTGAAAGTGSCTNQAVTAENADAAPSCSTITSSYVDGSVATVPIVTAGAGGVTAHLLVGKDTSNPIKYIALSGSGGCGAGFAATTAAPSATFVLQAIPGSIYTAIAQGSITAGHVVIGGTTAPGEVLDSGQTSRAAIDLATCTVGTAQASATDGQTVSIKYDGVGTFGTLISSADVPSNAANTSGNAATASALAATPAQCSAGQYATGITAAGAANCATPAGVPDSFPAFVICTTLGCQAETTFNNWFVSATGGVTLDECGISLATMPTVQAVHVDLQTLVTGAWTTMLTSQLAVLTTDALGTTKFVTAFAIASLAKGAQMRAMVTQSDTGGAALGGYVKCRVH